MSGPSEEHDAITDEGLVFAVHKLETALLIIDGEGPLALSVTPTLNQVAETLREKLKALEAHRDMLAPETRKAVIDGLLAIGDDADTSPALLAIVHQVQFDRSKWQELEAQERQAQNLDHWVDKENEDSHRQEMGMRLSIEIQEQQREVLQIRIETLRLRQEIFQHRYARSAWFFGLGSSLALCVAIARQRGIRDQWAVFYGGVATAHVLLEWCRPTLRAVWWAELW